MPSSNCNDSTHVLSISAGGTDTTCISGTASVSRPAGSAGQLTPCWSPMKTNRLSGRSGDCAAASAERSIAAAALPARSTSTIASTASTASSLVRCGSKLEEPAGPHSGRMETRLPIGRRLMNSLARVRASSRSVVPPSRSRPMLRLLSTTSTAWTGPDPAAAPARLARNGRAIASPKRATAAVRRAKSTRSRSSSSDRLRLDASSRKSIAAQSSSRNRLRLRRWMTSGAAAATRPAIAKNCAPGRNVSMTATTCGSYFCDAVNCCLMPSIRPSCRIGR